MNTATSTSRLNAALAVLRVVIGIVFIAHGWQKIFVYGIAGISGGFASIGLPPFLGPVIGIAELLGGIALVAGFLTPIASIGLSIIMLGAIIKVHIPDGFYNPKGVEFPLTLLAALVALLLTGGGAFSLDAALARRRSR